MPRKRTKKQTYVAFVLDESGSMANTRRETIDGFNEQLNVIKANAAKGGTTTVSLVKFGCKPDSHPRSLFFNKPVTALEPLTQETYVPFGNTPMYDGVGLALSELETVDASGNTAFLVIIISDGQENYSKEWTSARLAAKIKTLQDTGQWTFVYIGANQDLTKVREAFQLHSGNTAAYAASGVGTQYMAAATVSNTASYFNDVRGTNSMMTTTFNKVSPKLEEDIQVTIKVKR